MSLFITFEGIEGCGKTTQIRLLAEKLRQSGRQVLATREPGGCPIADAVRAILLDTGNSAMSPRAELLLYAAARAQHIDEVIRPALQAGTLVLCDRFTDATLAYQGFGRGLDRELINRLNDTATDNVVPNLTLLLDFAPEEKQSLHFSTEEGLRRARTRNDASEGPDEGRFEQESLDFHRRVRAGYLELAAKHERFRVIDARGSIEEVGERVTKAVDDFLAATEGP